MKKSGNPQLQDGYTPISNELLEALLRSDLGRHELLTIFAIMRQTYGWSRKEAVISVSMFVDLTGLHRRHVQRAIMSLLAKDLIGRSTGETMSFGKPVHKYVINKKICSQYGYRTVANRAIAAVANTAPNKSIKTNLNNKACGKVVRMVEKRRELIRKMGGEELNNACGSTSLRSAII